jgi:dTDP-4-dehydrorhamnose reductase
LRLLITGASGLFGSKLAEMGIHRNFEVHSGYSQEKPAFGAPIHLDILNENRVKEVFKELNPAVVVHAASLTNVDKCETNKALAWKTNVEGTEHIAIASKASHAFLVHISTDYIFNGDTGQYTETDNPDPINYYGFTKLKAEELVKDLINDYCIARTSVIYGATPAGGKVNFSLWLLSQLRGRKQVRIVTDQWNSPTLNTNLAAMTLEIIERKLTGIFNLSGATRISRYDFANTLAQTFNLNEDLIIPSTTAELSWIAKRPRDSSLNTSKTQQTLRNKPLDVHEALEELKLELARKTGNHVNYLARSHRNAPITANNKNLESDN